MKNKDALEDCLVSIPTLTRSGCKNYFSTLLFQTNLKSQNVITESLQLSLNSMFQKSSSYQQHPLEKGKAVSTWNDQNLRNLEAIQPLMVAVKKCAYFYWNQLGFERGRKMLITRCWANYHEFGGITLEHNHGPIHITGVYYVDVPPKSGNLLIRNPLEYHLASAPFGPPYGDRLWETINVQTGDLILMPGWLKHRTEESRSNGRRIVISFNIMGVVDDGKLARYEIWQD